MIESEIEVPTKRSRRKVSRKIIRHASSGRRSSRKGRDGLVIVSSHKGGSRKRRSAKRTY